ncbi:hypothetical protein BGZ54_000948, partial [Gamsiella multidivaricata]
LYVENPQLIIGVVEAVGTACMFKIIITGRAAGSIPDKRPIDELLAVPVVQAIIGNSEGDFLLGGCCHGRGVDNNDMSSERLEL